MYGARRDTAAAPQYRNEDTPAVNINIIIILIIMIIVIIIVIVEIVIISKQSK